MGTTSGHPELTFTPRVGEVITHHKKFFKKSSSSPTHFE